jgi:hypothetical protein
MDLLTSLPFLVAGAVFGAMIFATVATKWIF